MPLLEAWSDFAASFKIPGIIDNDDGMLTGDDCMILSVAAGTDRVFFWTGIRGGYTPLTRKPVVPKQS